MIKWHLFQILKSRYTAIAIMIFIFFNIFYLLQFDSYYVQQFMNYSPDYYYFNIFYTGKFTPVVIILFIFISTLIYTLESILGSDSYELMITQRTSPDENIKSSTIAIFIGSFLVLMLIMYMLHSFVFLSYPGKAIYLIDIPEELAFNGNLLALVKYPHLLTFMLTAMSAVVFASINSLIYKLSSIFTITRKLDKFLIPLLITCMPIFLLGIYTDYSIYSMLHFDIYNDKVNQITESIIIFLVIMVVLAIEFLIFSRLLPIIERVLYKGKVKQELKDIYVKIYSTFEANRHIDAIFSILQYIIFAIVTIIMLTATKSGFSTNIPYLGNSLEVFLTTKNPVFKDALSDYTLLWLPNMLLLVTVILLIIRFSSIYFEEAIILFRTRFISGFTMYIFFYYKMVIYTTKLFLVYLLASFLVFREYNFDGMLYYYATMYLILLTLTTMVFTIRILFNTKIALIAAVGLFITMYSIGIERFYYLNNYYREIIMVFNNNMGSYWHKLVIPHPTIALIAVYGAVISGLISLSYLIYIIKYKEYKILWLK